MIDDVFNARDRALEAAKKLKENQRYWVDFEHKKPDPSEIILTPTQQWAYVSDPQFKKKVNNMSKKEIQEWNKQSLEWERKINE
jgi:hypothetical protein